MWSAQTLCNVRVITNFAGMSVHDFRQITCISPQAQATHARKKITLFFITMQAALKDLFEMQQQAFDMKEEFQNQIYMEFSDNFLFFFKVFSIKTDSQATFTEFGMSMREFRPFRRRVLRMFESLRQSFYLYICHLTNGLKMRQLCAKLDQCAKKLLTLRRTPDRKTRLYNLQSRRHGH